MRRARLAWLVVAACAAASAGQAVDVPPGQAEGTLVLDGETYALRFACVREPSTLEVTLSTSRLDRSLLSRIDLGDLPAGIVVLGIRVDSRGRATSVYVREGSLPDGVLNNDAVGDFATSRLSPDLVVGTLSLSAPREIRGHRLIYSVRFRATPPPRGPIRNLDDALQRAPALRGFLERVASGLGKGVPIGCVSLLLLVAVLALVWKFVIAPRRAHRILMDLGPRGYAGTDRKSSNLAAAVESLAPFCLEGTVKYKEWPREILEALAATSGFHRRYVVNVSQMEEGQRIPGRGRDNRQIWQTLVLEERPLGRDSEIIVHPRGLQGMSPGREEKFGFRQGRTADGLPEFESLCCVFSRGEEQVAMAADLQRAFLDVCRMFPASAFFNARLGPRGWGICASDAWLDRTRMRALVDAADRLAAAL